MMFADLVDLEDLASHLRSFGCSVPKNYSESDLRDIISMLIVTGSSQQQQQLRYLITEMQIAQTQGLLLPAVAQIVKELTPGDCQE